MGSMQKSIKKNLAPGENAKNRHKMAAMRTQPRRDLKQVHGPDLFFYLFPSPILLQRCSLHFEINTWMPHIREPIPVKSFMHFL